MRVPDQRFEQLLHQKVKENDKGMKVKRTWLIKLATKFHQNRNVLTSLCSSNFLCKLACAFICEDMYIYPRLC